MSEHWWFQVLVQGSRSWLVNRTEEHNPEHGEIIATFVGGSKDELEEEDLIMIDTFLWDIYG